MSMFNNIYYFNADICVCHFKNKENNMSPLLKSGHIIINCNNVY